jgi:hypothetical protein
MLGYQGTPSNESYFDTLQKLIDKCVLGIIVLDGLRPVKILLCSKRKR